MKTYSRQPETKSDNAQPKASLQASAHDVLQAYKDKIIYEQNISKNRLDKPTTIGETLVSNTIGRIIEWYRGTPLIVNLNLGNNPILNGNNLEATIYASASGLAPDDWVDYQIKWGRNAVPGYNGNVIVNPHLGQQVNTAGGWMTDRPPLGHPDPMVREIDNPRYYDNGLGDNWQGVNWLFTDQISQSPQMAQGQPNTPDRQWRFRAIIRNNMGIPLKVSNEIVVQW